MIGGWSPRKLSNGFEAAKELTWLQIPFLSALGFLAVFLNTTLRLPLKLPGHHGLEWMFLLITGRSVSPNKWNASIVGFSAASFSFLPFWGFKEPFIWLTFLLPGLIIDIVYNKSSWRENAAFIALIAGLAFATKPLVKILISLSSGWLFGSLLSGWAYPTLTHFGFGFIGGLLGMGITKLLRKAYDP